jgi:serine/threonine kinase 32
VLPADSDKAASEALKQIINGFITRDITKRLGCAGAGGFTALKEHPFLNSLNWDDVEEKKTTPPFIPDVSKR